MGRNKKIGIGVLITLGIFFHIIVAFLYILFCATIFGSGSEETEPSPEIEEETAIQVITIGRNYGEQMDLLRISKVGETSTLEVEISGTGDYQKSNVEFVSEDEAVVTISVSDEREQYQEELEIEVTAVGVGETQIYAKTRDGSVTSEQISVIVEKAAPEPEPEPTPDPDTESQAEPEQEAETESESEPETESEDGIRVGSSFEDHGLTITVNSADLNFKDYNDSYGLLAPSDGMKYVMVSLTAENTGHSDEHVNISNFKCYADNEACEAAYLSDDDNFLFTDLSPGRNVSFRIYYTVPVDAQSIEVEYETNLWTGNKEVIILQ